MPSVILGMRISGARDAQGKVHQFPKTVLNRIKSRADRRAGTLVRRLKQEMASEYTSAWATGKLAAGITHKVSIKDNGVDIQFFVPNLPELHYVTAALGGYFQRFPVLPFEIRPIPPGKALLIPFPNSRARRFIRGEKGRMAGSRTGAIMVKSVLWGRRTGGFSRDVITEVAQEEGALFVQEMQNAVKDAIIEVTT